MNIPSGTRLVKRRSVLAAAIGTTATVLLAACGAPAAPTATPAPKPVEAPTAPKPTEAAKPAAQAPTAAPKPTEAPKPTAAPTAKPLAEGRLVTMTMWAQTIPGEQAKAELFTKEHPNIKVEIANVATGGQGAEAVQKFLTAIAAGTAASVVFFDLVRADNYDLKRFIKPCIVECYGIDGKLYGLPRHYVNRWFLVNADHLKEDGINPEGELTDWQYLKSVAVKLTKKDGGGRLTRIGIQPNYIDLAYTWGWSNGGQWVTADGKQATMDDPRNVEAWQFAADIAEAMGGQEKINAFASGFETGAGEPFFVGKISLRYGGQTQLRQLAQFKPDLNLRVFMFPAKNAGDPKTSWSGGHAWVMPRGAKEKDIAWELMKAWVSWPYTVVFQEAQKELNAKSKAPYLGELTGQADQDAKLMEKYRTGVELIDKAAKIAIDWMTDPKVNTHIRPLSPAALEMWDAVRGAYEETMLKKKTPAQALKDANTKVQKVLDEAWASVGR